MKTPFSKLLAAVVAAVVCTAAFSAELKWSEDLDAALAVAKSSGKTVLVDFTGSDWCGYCIKLENEVLSKDAFKEWADKDLVLVELDFPRKKEQPAELKARNSALREKYEVPGYPTVILMNGDGKILHTEVGFEPGKGEEWLATMKKAAAGETSG